MYSWQISYEIDLWEISTLGSGLVVVFFLTMYSSSPRGLNSKSSDWKSMCWNLLSTTCVTDFHRRISGDAVSETFSQYERDVSTGIVSNAHICNGYRNEGKLIFPLEADFKETFFMYFLAHSKKNFQTTLPHEWELNWSRSSINFTYAQSEMLVCGAEARRTLMRKWRSKSFTRFVGFCQPLLSLSCEVRTARVLYVPLLKTLVNNPSSTTSV